MWLGKFVSVTQVWFPHTLVTSLLSLLTRKPIRPESYRQVTKIRKCTRNPTRKMGFQQRPSDSWLLFCCTAIFVFRFTFAFSLSNEVPQIDGWSSLVSPLNRCAEKIVSCIKNYTKLCNNSSHLLRKISFSFTPFNLQGENKAVATELNPALWVTVKEKCM